MPNKLDNDPFRNRGAVEQDTPGQDTNLDFKDQMAHRNKGPLVDSKDTDFPEPGENPEHSGELIRAGSDESKSDSSRRPEKQAPSGKREEESESADEIVDQDPGERQREIHSDEKDDPLAA